MSISPASNNNSIINYTNTSSTNKQENTLKEKEHLKPFIEYSSRFKKLFPSHIPIINIIQAQFYTYCFHMNQLNKESTLKTEFIPAWHDLIIKNKFEGVNKLIAKVITKETSPEAKVFFKLIQLIFKKEDLELLKSPPKRFFLDESINNSNTLSRAYVQTCKNLASSLDTMFKQIGGSIDGLNALFNKTQVEPWVFYSQNLERTLFFLKNTDAITPKCKKNIYSIRTKIEEHFVDVTVKFCNAITTILTGDIFAFINLMNSHELNDICNYKNPDMQNLDFVINNRAQFKNFNYRAKENVEWVKKIIIDCKETAFLLSNFNLFLQFGDLSAIHNFTKDYYTFYNLEKFFFEEIKTFYQGSKSNLELIKKIIKGLKSNQKLNEEQNLYSDTHILFCNNEIILETFGNLTIKTCKEFSKYLPNNKLLQTPGISQVSLIDNDELQQESEEIKNKSTIDSTSFQTTPVNLPTHKPPLPLDGAIFSLRNMFLISFEKLYSCSNAYGYNVALKNAEYQMEQMIVVLQRYDRLSKTCLSIEQLFSFGVDSVVHSTLFIEQLLSAANLKTNNSKNQEDLKNLLGHDLEYSLNQCKFGLETIPKRSREKIIQTSYGEIDSRRIVFFAEHEHDLLSPSSAKNLLKTLYLWKEGKIKKDFCEILNSLEIYKTNIFHTGLTLMEKISSNEETVLRKQIDILKRGLVDSIQKVELSEVASPKVLSIEGLLIKLLEDPSVPTLAKIGLENITKNLLARLKVELHHHESCPLSELHLNYAHILLLNQQIAEEFLYQIAAIKNIKVDKKKIDHDLTKLLLALGLKVEDNINSFLSHSQWARRFFRYPSSFHTKKGEEWQELAYSCSQLSRAHALDTTSHQKDFSLEQEKENTVKLVKEVIVKDVKSLADLIEKMCLYIGED